jgi:hypothetical protein
MDFAKEWFGAQGVRQGKPILTRGRNPKYVWDRREAYPYLLCVDLMYEASDPVGLPSEAQYKDIADFEELALDWLDGDGGFLVLTKSGDGKVRYFCYVDDPETVADEIAARAGKKNLEYSSDYDPQWGHYVLEIERLGLTPPSS